MVRIILGCVLCVWGVLTVIIAFTSPEKFADAATARWAPLLVFGLPGAALIYYGRRARRRKHRVAEPVSFSVPSYGSAAAASTHAQPTTSAANAANTIGGRIATPGEAIDIERGLYGLHWSVDPVRANDRDWRAVIPGTYYVDRIETEAGSRWVFVRQGDALYKIPAK